MDDSKKSVYKLVLNQGQNSCKTRSNATTVQLDMTNSYIKL